MDMNRSSESEGAPRRSIRQISKSTTAEDRNYSSASERPVTESPLFPERRYKSSKKMNWGLWAGGAFVLLFLFIVLSSLGGGATARVYPNAEKLSLSNEEVELLPPGSEGGFSYEEMTLSKELGESMEATGEEEVSERAQGTITIYNNFGEESEQLVAQTRFRSPDGKIYRIQEAVVIPGRSGDTPGSVQAEVIAAEPGEEFNIGPSRFDVPGFEESDTERFRGIYAESKDAFEGGFEGEMKTVDEGDKAEALERLEEKLQEDLLAEASSKLPSNMMLLEDKVDVKFTELPNKAVGEKVEVRLKGTLTAGVIDKDKLAGFIASNNLADYDGEPVQFADPKTVTIKVLGASDARDEDEESEDEEEVVEVTEGAIVVSVSGNTSIVSKFSEGELKEKLVGARIKDLASIAESFPGIEKIEVDMKPFWKRSLPETKEDITVETVLE